MYIICTELLMTCVKANTYVLNIFRVTQIAFKINIRNYEHRIFLKCNQRNKFL